MAFEWIYAGQQQPEINRPVLVWDMAIDEPCLGYRERDGRWYVVAVHNEPVRTTMVTHWAYLPKSPVERPE